MGMASDLRHEQLVRQLVDADARFTTRLTDPEAASESLVGREREIRALEDAFGALPDGGTTLLLRGEPGVGKSALLDLAAERAGGLGMRTLKTIGVQSEAEMPFAGVHQLLRPVIARASDLPVRQRHALSAAFGSSADSPEMFLVALATLSLLSDVATPSPLAILVEDAHWLDDESCEVLTFVARRIESDPIVLLISSREGTETAFDRANVPGITIDRLDAASALALLEREAPDLPDAVSERILSDAAGNPLALRELPIAWREHGQQDQPPEWMPLTARLEHTFAARARALPEITRTLLLTAALNSTGSLGEALDAASRASRAHVTVGDLAPAETVRLIEVHERSFRFRHPLIASAIRQSADMARRHAAHASLAETLEGHDDRWIWHRAACTVGPDEAVAAELESAAARLQQRVGGAAIAAAALERAAQLTPDPPQRARRLLATAELSHGVGKRDMAGRLLAVARTLELNAPERRRLEWLEEFMQQGKGSGNFSSLVAIADEMRDDGKPEDAVRCLWTAAQKCWWSDSYLTDRELVLAAIERLPEPGHPSVLATRLFCDPTDRDALARARAYVISEDDRARSVHGAIRIGAALTTVPDPGPATRLLGDALAKARTDGQAGLVCEALVSLCDAALYSGDLTLALRSADECVRLAEEMRRPAEKAFAQLTQATVLGIRGDEARATDLLVDAEADMVARGLKPWACFLEVAWSAIDLAAGRHQDAFSHIRRSFDPTQLAFNPLIASRGLLDLVDAGLRTGRRCETQACVDQVARVAEQSHAPFLELSLRHAAAVLAQDDEADALFEAAADTTASPFLHARLLLHHGARLRRQRRISESRTLLRDALSTLDALGAVPWADRARQELRASGEATRIRAVDSRDHLTPQELQIAQMAANGLTNREIGERLFLSHRTVGSHLYRIFPKLEVSSRAELARALSRDAGPA